MGSMTLLNETGDVTLSWNKDQDERMRAMIEAKLKKGYTFFVIKRFCGFKIHQRKLKALADLKPSEREVVLKDEDIALALEDNSEGIFIDKAPEGDMSDAELVKEVDKIVKEDTLAVRPIAAG